MSTLLEPADLDGGRKTVKIAWIERGLNAMDVVTSDGKRIEIDGRIMGALTPMLGADMSKWTGRELFVEADATLRGGLHVTVKPEERPRSTHHGLAFVDPDARARAAGLPGYEKGGWINSSFNK